MQKLSGGGAAVESLRAEKVKHIFGLKCAEGGHDKGNNSRNHPVDHGDGNTLLQPGNTDPIDEFRFQGN